MFRNVVLACTLVLSVTGRISHSGGERDTGSRASAQAKYYAMRPFPVGVVFIQDPRRHKTMDDILDEFKRIKDTGFTCLKQVMLNNISDAFVADVFNAALDAGLEPWWYGKGGWDDITPELLHKVGLPVNTTIEAAEASPLMIQYQTNFLRARVANMSSLPPYTPPAPKGPGLNVLPMDSSLVPYFASWLSEQYDGDIDALMAAWHSHATVSGLGSAGGSNGFSSRNVVVDAAAVAGGYGLASTASASGSVPSPLSRRGVGPAGRLGGQSFRNFTEAAMSVAAPSGASAPTPGQWAFENLGANFHFSPWQPSGWDRDYRRSRDAMLFHAQHKAALELDMCRFMRKHDPQQPVRVGGETMLLWPQPLNGWRRELMADVARECGAYYDSLHLPWHYELSNVETQDGQHSGFYRYDADQSLYSMARYIADGGRGQWVGAFESSGGPALFSGGQDSGIDGGQIQRMFVNYLSAGLRGIGVWSWNARWQGQEAGGYALTTLQGEVGERALAAGNVSKAIQRERWTLWEADDEPVVAVVHSWEAEAANSRMGQAGGPVVSCTVAGCRDRWAQEAWQHVKARLGAAAALTATGVPWQWVSEGDLAAWGAAGLVSRGFRSVVLPGLVSANSSGTLPVLLDFVNQGGTVVADSPAGMLQSPSSDLVDHFRPSDEATQGSRAAPAVSWADVFGAGAVNWQSTANGYDRVVSRLPGAVGLPVGEGLLVQGVTADLRAAPGNKDVRLVAEPSGGQPDGREWASAAVWDRAGGRSVLLAMEAGRLAFAEGPVAEANLWPALGGGQREPPVPPMSGLGAWSRLLAHAVTRNYTLIPGGAETIGSQWQGGAKAAALGPSAWRVVDLGRAAGRAQAGAGAFGPGLPPVQLPGLKVFRRAAPGRGLDYFFFVNSRRDATRAGLVVGSGAYGALRDAVSLEEVSCEAPSGGFNVCEVEVPAHGAAWIAAKRA